MTEHDGLDRLISAEQDERRRIALFLHDGPVQQLSGIALMLDGALHAITDGNDEEATRIITLALQRHRATIRELRDLSFVLEPVVLRDQGLLPAIRGLADQVAGTHSLHVDVEAGDLGDLGETAQVTVYTLIRELVEQSLRRSPLTWIRIAVTRNTDGTLVTSVADDAEPERRRRAFEAIEERARELHGTIVVLTGGAGTEVRVTLPADNVRR